MIHSIFVINESGETLASINVGEFDMDDDLFGGFLSAIQMYSQMISGKNMKEFSMDRFRVVVGTARDLYVVTIHDSRDKNFLEASNRVRKILEASASHILTEDTLDALRKAAEMSKKG